MGGEFGFTDLQIATEQQIQLLRRDTSRLYSETRLCYNNDMQLAETSPSPLLIRRRGERGSTLVEVVITLAILSVVFVVFQASFNTIFLNRRVKHEELALRVADTKMEQIRLLTYDTVPTSGSFYDSLLASLPEAAAALEVSDYDDDTKHVAVTVSWQEPGSNAPRAVTLTTLVAKGGL